VDWRVGADWFEATLLDYDPHSNWGQWARTAGVVPTNEAKRQRVGGTRYFDIALGHGGGQAARYIRAWVPELASVPDESLFAPWQRGGDLAGYPKEPLCSPDLRRYFEHALARLAGKGGGKQGGRGPKGEQSGWGRKGGGQGKGAGY